MIAIFVIAGTAAAVWGLWLALRGSLVHGCAIFLVLGSCLSVAYYRVDALGFTWSLDRFFLVGLVAAFGLQWHLGRTQPKPLGRTEWLLCLFTGLLLLSTFAHDWRVHEADEVSILMHLVNGYLIPLVIYWVARQARLGERDVTAVHRLLVGFGIYLAVTALLEISRQWWLVWPRYIADPTLGIHFGRARGPMLQSAEFGMYLAVCLAATWITWAWQARLRRAGQLLAVALLPLYGAAVWFTYTRSVWIGAGLAAAVVIGLSMRGPWRSLLLGSMLATALLAGVTKKEQLVAFQREYTAAETRESTYMRGSFAYVSWRMFQDRPWLGFGFGQFPRENQQYLDDRSTPLRLQMIRGYIHHNTFLSLLVELGILGLLLFVALLVRWAYASWQLWRDPQAPAWVQAHGLLLLAALGPYLLQLVFREVSYSPLENSLIFLLAGIASGLRQAPASYSSCKAP